eukprot:Tbor_TRINITY_DN5500_c0_g1::TRINITY_DN5500_c0_g1_i1::g.12831::m.12831/K10766/ALKBH4; alkylated DNA repair protein alkB homolog 4
MDLVTENTCNCRGVRFCSKCEYTDRVQKLKASIRMNAIDGDMYAASGAVIDSQCTLQRKGGCTFAELPDHTPYWLCHQCLTIVTIKEDIPAPDNVKEKIRCVLCCDDHNPKEKESGETLEGLLIIPDFISVEEEHEIVCFLDDGCKNRFEGWKLSQNGRRKQDFGPNPNFKKKKLKLRAGLPGMPEELRPFLTRVGNLLDKTPYTPCRPQNQQTEEENKNPIMRPFRVAECSSLDYDEDCQSSLDPHIDDTWLWGDRVVGMSLLNTTVMTFVGKNKMVDVVLKPRSLFVMSGPSRYEWLHGIRAGRASGRRVSVTTRELSVEFEHSADPETLKLVRDLSSTYV